MGCCISTVKFRNSNLKYETISNFKNSNYLSRTVAGKILCCLIVSVIEKFGFIICFGLRVEFRVFKYYSALQSFH